MKYRKKPVIIEAFEVDELLEMFEKKWSELPKYIVDAYDKGIINSITSKGFFVKTLEGTMAATTNDYLVRGVDGEFYPCKKDIFRKTYEIVKE